MAEASDDFDVVDSGGVQLNDEQNEKLIQYQEVTGTDNFEIAKQKLLAHSWNLEAAVDDALNEFEGFSPVYNQQSENDANSEENSSTPSQSSSTFDRDAPYMASTVNTLINQRQMTWMEWLLSWVLVPYRFTISVVTDFFTFVVRLVWPSFNRRPQNAIEDVLHFKTNFDLRYGSSHPNFYQGTYSQVLADAKKELRFLLVYLHSESHQNTSKFCTEVLCNPGFREYVNGNMLFWACDVNSYEGYRVSRAFSETTYPFLAVVCLRENRMTIVWKIAGYMPVDKLIALLSRVIDENEPALVAARAEKEERSASQAIREEQDREFLRTQELDREKARKRKALEDAKREEENKKLAKQLDKERKAEGILQRKEACRKKLEQSTEPCSTDSNVIQIKVKLPEGTVLSRCFATSDPFQLLVDFVYGHEKTPSEFQLNSNFPRKTYHVNVESSSTIEDVGICTSTILFVQDLTEESSDEE